MLVVVALDIEILNHNKEDYLKTLKLTFHEKEYNVLIDDDDFERVSKFKWHLREEKNGTLYVDGTTQSLHRFIMGAEKGTIVDHINRDTLDNQKSNLRFVSKNQNCWNTKKYKKNPENESLPMGVRLKGKNFWARIKYNNVGYSLGKYATVEEAEKVHTKAKVLRDSGDAEGFFTYINKIK